MLQNSLKNLPTSNSSALRAECKIDGGNTRIRKRLFAQPSAKTHLDYIKRTGGDRAEARSAETRSHRLQHRELPSVALLLAPQQPVEIVLGPEEAHLVGPVPHDGGRGARPETPKALLPCNDPYRVDWALQKSAR